MSITGHTERDTFFKIEVKVEGDWLPMERIDPMVANVEARHPDILKDAHELYGKPVRLVKVNRVITVLQTLEVG